MKKFILYIVFFFIWIAGCNGKQAGIQPATVINTPEVVTVIPSTETATSTLPPTATIVPTIKPAKTKTRIPIVPQFSTPTLGTDNVLPREKRDEAWRAYLAQDFTCDTPCIWGISPGTTTLTDIYQQFETLGYVGYLPYGNIIFGDTTHFLYNMYFPHPNSGDTIDFYSNDEIIDAIGLDLYDEFPYRLVDFPQWSIERVFEKYGSPSQIEINLHKNTSLDNYYNYQFVVYFEKDNIFFVYDGNIQPDMQICPAFRTKFYQTVFFHLSFLSPESELPLWKYAEKYYSLWIYDSKEWSSQKFLYTKTEGPEGMTSDQIYQIFMQQGKDGCIPNPMIGQ